MYIKITNRMSPTCDHTVDVDEIHMIQPDAVGSTITLKNGKLYLISERLTDLFVSTLTQQGDFIELTGENNKKFLLRRSLIRSVDDKGSYRYLDGDGDTLWKVLETYEQLKATL